MPDLFSIIAWAIAALALVVGASVFGAFGLLAVLVAGFVLLAVASVLAVGHARRERLAPDARFRPTGEAFVDPASGRRMRVYVDPATGERRYRAEL